MALVMADAMADVQGVILDMDGVLWHGETPLPGLRELFTLLDGRALPYVLATNNATKTAADYTRKLLGFGVAVPEDRILTSSEAAAGYLRRTYPDAREVYVVGEAGLRRAVAAQGFAVVAPEAVRAGARPPILVGGLAQASLSYEMLAMAVLVLNGGAAFVATNADATLPTELGLLPGAGAVLSVLSTATGRSPTVIGKPERPMFEEALLRLGTPAGATWMVGDRLSTDIAGAQGVGMPSVLLLSGVSSRADLERWPVAPDLVLEDIRALETWLRRR